MCHLLFLVSFLQESSNVHYIPEHEEVFILPRVSRLTLSSFLMCRSYPSLIHRLTDCHPSFVCLSLLFKVFMLPFVHFNPFTPMCRFSDTFFKFFCTQATLLIIIQFHSNLHRREVCCISFLGKRQTAHSTPVFYNSQILHQKMTYKWCALVKNWNLFFKYLLNGARYQQNSNTFKFQRMGTFSTVKIKKIKYVHC